MRAGICSNRSFQVLGFPYACYDPATDSCPTLSVSSELLPVEVARPTRVVKPRSERFETVFKYLDDGLTAQREVRKTTWMKLFQLAETPAQMERVVATFPRWRAMRKSFDEADAELFARECCYPHLPLVTQTEESRL